MSVFRSILWNRRGGKAFLPSVTLIRLLDKRYFSVKELSWCAPKSSPNRRAPAATFKDNGNIEKSNGNDEPIQLPPPEPISSFGIVAAMSRNRVIGLNGKIPWPRCAEDRKTFKNLTRDSIMIIGRKTFEEEPNQKHICHTRHCIVVSRSLTKSTLENLNQGAPNTNLVLAKSLPDALGISKYLFDESYKTTKPESDNKIVCWVAGGERLYEEALKHESAKEVHLTTMDLDVDIKAIRSETQNNQLEYALFPAKHRWDRHFQEISRVQGGPRAENPFSPNFTYVVYVRKKLPV